MLGNEQPKFSKIKPDWSQLDWKAITTRVSRIQRQIYKRTLAGESVHGPQRALVELFEAKLLAVRRVGQNNSGKKTAGANVGLFKNPIPTQRSHANSSSGGGVLDDSPWRK